MVLKSLEIFGFKSFADRSKIDFTDGISALLGPNGCGKSNVVDAIKWVLGEQSSRSLRAEKMEDVIFGGTETRKALNVAEVTLVLSNEESILPIELTEVEIKRRLYRNGESIYLINNTPAKLKEIRELFFDTGIGKSAYSVMEQGKIDQILSNKPDERRKIFEEAAGITKYKLRGQEADRKLRSTEENMSRVESILKEVKRSYDTLKVQADKTKKYRELQDSIFELELEFTLLRMKDFLDDKNRKVEQLEEKKKQRQTVREQIEEINKSMEINLNMVSSMESELIENQKRLYGIDLEKGNKKSQLALYEERKSETESKITENREKEKSLLLKVENQDKKIDEETRNLEELHKQLRENEKNIRSYRESIELTAQRISENEKKISSNDDDIARGEKERVRFQEELRSLTEDIVTQLDEKLKETGYSYKERARIEEEIDHTLQGLKIIVEGRGALLGDAKDLSGKDSSEIAKLLTQSLDSWGESKKLVDSLFANFGEYKKTVPSFLDEFLSPEGIITQKRNIDDSLAATEKSITEKREENKTLGEENRRLVRELEEARSNLEELKISSVRMNTQKQAIERNVKDLQNVRSEYTREIDDNKSAIENALTLLQDIQKKITSTAEELTKIEGEEKELKKKLTELEKHIANKNSDLIVKEKKIKDLMQKSEAAQKQVEKQQMDLVTTETEIRNLYENFRERHSRDLTQYEDRIYEIQKQKESVKNDLGQHKESLKNLGQINLMAPEEFEEVRERYEFLQNQLEDLQKAKDDLKKITQQITVESEELFLSTYNQIKKNFHMMFRRLFGGGRAELTLDNSESVLEAGIEIFAQPPGKKLENITLLSGGERSMTAVSLLFAMYMVRPSPFCILDEIDAALDENNVGRFVNLLDEFSKTSQFIIITHNKKTVSGANTLLGVTMAESGVSKNSQHKIERQETGETVV